MHVSADTGPYGRQRDAAVEQALGDVPLVRTGSPDLDAPRPSLSLAKLYLGYWVAYHGAPGDQAKVEQMIRFSDDAIASALDVRYPQAIDEIARDFGLTATVRHGRWGATTTSAHDVARFIHEIQPDPVASTTTPTAASASPVTRMPNRALPMLPAAVAAPIGAMKAKEEPR